MVLTHTGRKSGKPYDVIIWFVVEGDAIYLTTLNSDRQWVRNIGKNPEVRMKIGNEQFSGRVRPVNDSVQYQHIRDLLAQKYLPARIFDFLSPLISRFIPDRRAGFRVNLNS